MGHSGAHHPIRREWAKKIVVDSCILCPNQEKKELCYLFCQNHRKHLPRHRAIPLSIRIRHPHLTTKLQSGPVMSEPGNARELESSEKVLQMWISANPIQNHWWATLHTMPLHSPPTPLPICGLFNLQEPWLESDPRRWNLAPFSVSLSVHGAEPGFVLSWSDSGCHCIGFPLRGLQIKA